MDYALTSGTSILRSDGAVIPNDPANLDYAAYLAWRSEGGIPAPYVLPVVDMRVVIAEGLTDYFNGVARTKNYDSRITCALRAGYPGPFHEEGAAFATWMDTCNALAYQMLYEVQAGTRPMPGTLEEALELLPPMVWPTPAP